MNAPATDPPASPRRGRWKRRLLIGLALLVVAVALAPFVAGPFLRRAVVNALEERLDVRASVQSVSFAWPARLHVHELELSDSEGAPLAALDDLQASLALAPLFGGRIEAEVVLAYPQLHLARTREGHWNWERTLAKVASARAPESSAAHGEEKLPALTAHLKVTDGHVVIHGAQGETTLSDIALDVRVDGLDHPSPFRLSLAVGPEGAAGRVALEGSFTAASAGRIEALGFAGDAKLAIETLDLAAFAPALALVAPVTDLAGKLDGRAELGLGAGLALTGQTDLALSELALRGPLSGVEPTRIARIELHGHATQQGEGAGSQHLELSAGSFLALAYEGHSSLPARGNGELAGKLTLSGDLARLSEIARGWVPLQPGVAVQGRVEQSLELGAALVDRQPISARANAHGGVTGLAARDARGRALDLAELNGLALDLVAAADLRKGTLTVPKLALRAGPVSCEGDFTATGLTLGGPARALELGDGKLHFTADLERLRGTLTQLIALDGSSFGGRLEADATLAHQADGLLVAATLDGRDLVGAGTRLASLHAELRARRSEDRVTAASGELHLGALTLALAPEPLALPGAVLSFNLQENATGRGEHSLGLRTDDGALSLTVQARSTRDPDDPSVEATLQTALKLEARVAKLAELAAPFAPLRAGLTGDLLAQGDLFASFAGTTPTKSGGKLELFFTGLGASDAHGQRLALDALARTTVALDGEFDLRAGRGELRSLALDAGGLKLRGSAHGLALGAAAVPELADGKFELEADLGRLGGELARVVDLGGWTISGSPLTAEAQVTSKDGRTDASGHLASEHLELQRPERAPLAFADLGADFDLGYDAGAGSLHVRKADAHSAAGTLALSGTLNDLTAPERAHGAMQLELAARLERVLADLGLETSASGRKTTGALASKLKIEGDRGAFRVTGHSTVEGFRLELAPATKGEPPTVIEEPSIALDCIAKVALPALDVDLERLALESGLARGGAQGRIENLGALGSGEVRFVDLKGNLAYVPERLGAVLAPFLPGKLVGAEEQRLTFVLDGKARELDLASVLAGTEARVDLGLGRFERPEIQVGGALALETKDKKLALQGDLAANGGTLQLDATLDLDEDTATPSSRLAVKAKGLRANSGLAPLLAYLHPAFAASALTQGELGGLIGLDLDLAYDGALTPRMLAGGWDALPKEPIHGSGRLELAQASLRGSPLFGLLAELGIDATRTLDLRPIEFTIQKGRVAYAKPWTWNFSGTETSFTGSIGLDQSLDLTWNVPVTDALVRRFGFLAALKGENLAVPLRGSVKKPHLELDQLVKDLGAKAAQAELESRLGLGKKASGDDPDALLSRADELWSKGQKTEAAALYLRLRDEFKLSLTYALNKDRIKDRSKYKETPK